MCPRGIPGKGCLADPAGTTLRRPDAGAGRGGQSRSRPNAAATSVGLAGQGGAKSHSRLGRYPSSAPRSAKLVVNSPVTLASTKRSFRFEHDHRGAPPDGILRSAAPRRRQIGGIARAVGFRRPCASVARCAVLVQIKTASPASHGVELRTQVSVRDAKAEKPFASCATECQPALPPRRDFVHSNATRPSVPLV